MGRNKIYENDAERKKAYRLRLSGPQTQNSQPVPSVRRPPSRPKRLATALSVVEALHDEYEGGCPQCLNRWKAQAWPTAYVRLLRSLLRR